MDFMAFIQYILGGAGLIQWTQFDPATGTSLAGQIDLSYIFAGILLILFFRTIFRIILKFFGV